MYRDKHYTFKILWYWSTFHFDIDMLPQYGKSEQLALNEFFSYQRIMTSLLHYSLFKLSFLAIYSECPVLSLTMHIYILATGARGVPRRWTQKMLGKKSRILGRRESLGNIVDNRNTAGENKKCPHPPQNCPG